MLTPRVAAIHDLSGFGRCSLTVAIPILSAMGLQCCPLPTAFLSTHTGGFEGFTFLDMTEEMPRVAAHWKSLDLWFQAIYSGFLGSVRQIDIVEAFIRQFCREDTIVVVDPVMGDDGRAYRTYTPQMCAGMARLAELADVITPNLTEAALLLGEDYADAPRSEAGMREWLRRLSLNGKRSVVITGVSLAPEQLGAGCFDRESGRTHFAMARQEPGQFPGTGDLFASVVLGDLLRGQTLPHGVELAVAFVQQCVHRTLALGTPTLEGVQFEQLLGELIRK